jgi:predicted ArsR family transcriptional regulator
MRRLDALGDAGVRKTLLFVRASATAVSADDVAEALELPRSVARWRLEKLVDAGLAEAAFERRAGAGRPAKLYAPAAETSAIEFPPRRYETLVALLSEAMPRRKLREIGARYAQGLADEIRGVGLTRMCQALGRLGFHVAVEDESPDGAVLVSATCPLRPLVREHPGSTAIDEGMWSGLIAAATGGAAAIKCGTHDCLEGGKNCRILVQFSR